MIEKIWEFIQKHQMLSGCTAIAAGVSGGADSVGLLLVLEKLIKTYNLGIHLTAVHVNHQIRGPEAKRDEAFVKDFCKRLGVECVCYTKNIPLIAEQQGLSCEEAGRKVRYELFKQEADRLSGIYGGKAVIAVAHHKNDNAETVLMHLLRGSGFAGISGIVPVRENIIRPLLCVSRPEIEKFLENQKQTFVIDSTNKENDYTRNRIRNECIPYLEENFNPNASKHLCELSELAYETEKYLCSQGDKLYKSCVTLQKNTDNTGKLWIIDIKRLNSEPQLIQSYAIRRVLAESTGRASDVYKIHIDNVLSLKNLQTGRRVRLPKNIAALRQYNSIIVGTDIDGNAAETANWSVKLDGALIDKVLAGEPYCIPINKKVCSADGKVRLVREILIERSENFEISDNNSYTKYFNYDTIKGSTNLRFQLGKMDNQIVINGNGSKKSLKKELKDRKIPQIARSGIMVLADGEQILWAIGVRQSFDSMVNAKAKRILRIEVKLQKE